jgi:hypothetical protein
LLQLEVELGFFYPYPFDGVVFMQQISSRFMSDIPIEGAKESPGPAKTLVNGLIEDAANAHEHCTSSDSLRRIEHSINR